MQKTSKKDEGLAVTAPLSKSVCLPLAAKLAALFCLFMLSLVANLLAPTGRPGAGHGPARLFKEKTNTRKQLSNLKIWQQVTPEPKGISHELGHRLLLPRRTTLRPLRTLKRPLRESSGRSRCGATTRALLLLQRQASTSHSGAGKRYDSGIPNENIDAILCSRSFATR